MGRSKRIEIFLAEQLGKIDCLNGGSFPIQCFQINIRYISQRARFRQKSKRGGEQKVISFLGTRWNYHFRRMALHETECGAVQVIANATQVNSDLASPSLLARAQILNCKDALIRECNTVRRCRSR